MAGECTGICKAFSGLLAEFQTINGFGRSCSNFQFQRFQSSKGLLFKVHNDDNDFSDLGAPIERAFGQLKLVTEKRDPFPKFDNGREVSSSKSHSKSMQHVKGKVLTLDEPYQSGCGNGDDASGSTYTTSDAACIDVRRSISVGNVPFTISLSQFVEAVSVFGKFCAASVRHHPDGLNCWDIQFKSLESRNRAVRAGALNLGIYRLPIQPPQASMDVTIRIEDISDDASLNEMHSICKSFGRIEGLAWTTGLVLVHYFPSRKYKTVLTSFWKKLEGGINPNTTLLYHSSIIKHIPYCSM